MQEKTPSLPSNLESKGTPPSLKFKTEKITNKMGFADLSSTPDIALGIEESYFDTV